MNIKVSLLSFLTAGLVIAGNANAATNADYFMGANLGANLSGDVETNGQGIKDSQDIGSTLIWGVHGGVILNNSHRITMAYQHTDLEIENEKISGIGTVKTKYDYMFSVAKNLSWTAGGQLGYEMYDEKVLDDLNGVVYGVQTGLDYRLGDWSLGAEVEYVLHNAKSDMNGFQSELGNNTNFITNVAYHF